jgi:signal transduction histidine kinase
VSELFAGLRGMFRPLMVGSNVTLILEEGPQVIEMYSDEGRVSQILRNFVSNAIKFTEAGAIRVSATLEPAAGTAADHDSYDDENEAPAPVDMVRFDVRDTGIGIADADMARIFRDFEQVDNSVQRRVRGTGLGLPVSNKLAALLGGSIDVHSVPGEGSTFILRVPVRARVAQPSEPSHAVGQPS